jgi:cholesterol transport system auxiliary component
VKQSFVIGIALLASGCASGLLESDAPPDRIYTLRANGASTEAYATVTDARIKVARPRVAPGLDSDRIAVRTGSHELDYYRGARWEGTAAAIVQSYLVDSLRASGAFALVVPEEAPVTTDYLLDLELAEFHADQAGGGMPTARVRIVATLVDMRDRRLVSSFTTGATVAAQENRLGAVADAMDAATREAAAEIDRRLASDLARDAAASSP